MNLNKVFILGNVTADPQLRSTSGGQSVATFGVATNRFWNDRNGQRQQGVEFHNVVVWGKQAELSAQFLKKGNQVFIEGRLQSRQWADKQGQQRKVTEIICENIQFPPRQGTDYGTRVDRQPHSGAVPPKHEGKDAEPQEEIPIIDVDESEIKPEDLPF